MKQKCLPTYLVIDGSYSMSPYEQALNSTLTKLHSTLAESPRVSEFALLSLIAFSTVPQLVIEMTDMEQVECVPVVRCNGQTNYSAAFRLVRERIDIDVPRLKTEGRAVLRPTVFFLTDGEPNDPEWHTAFRRLTDPAWSRRPHVITYGFGSSPDAVLGKVATKAAFRADDGADQDVALSNAINSLVNSLVASSQNEEMLIPTTATGYTPVPIEYMD